MTRCNATACRSIFPLKALSLAIALTCTTGAEANPTGAQVVNGQASIVAAGKTLSITNTAGAILNWQSFSIGANEVTRFIQPSATSSVLNRVVGPDPSTLLGQLASNGRVFLINPAGILVGSGARIDTAGFIASTLNLSNSNFLAGKLNFSGNSGAGVVNQGQIVTPTGGSVYLIGSQVGNEGLIHTPGGETLLAAGHSVRLVDSGTPGLSVEVSGGGQATNLGTITADAGRVGIAGALVRQAGTINASSLVREGGRVFLKASQRAEVENGAIDVSSAVSTGGRIEITGDQVALRGSSTLNASGATGGGQILVGGGLQGKDTSLTNATATTVDAGVTLKADALDLGDGGLVVAWANGDTTTRGTFSAQGGTNGGNGGRVETSGKQHLDFHGTRVSTRAPRGRNGFWLLDPTDIVLTADDAGSLSGALASGDVILQADNDITMPSGLTIQPSSWSGTAPMLTFKAGRDIMLQGNSIIKGAQDIYYTYPLNVVLWSNASGTGGGITVGGDPANIGGIYSNGGNIYLSGGNVPDIATLISTGYAVGASASNLSGISVTHFNLRADGTSGGGDIVIRGKAPANVDSSSGVWITNSDINAHATVFNSAISTKGSGKIVIDGVSDGVNVGTGRTGVRLYKANLSVDGRNGGSIDITGANGGWAIYQDRQDGLGLVDSSGGNITMTATTGSIYIAGDVQADGVSDYGYAGHGGLIQLTAHDHINIAPQGVVSANGGLGGCPDGCLPAGIGGEIKLFATSTGSDITINGILRANGGEALGDGSTSAGTAGSITVNAGSTVTVYGTIQAEGGVASTTGDTSGGNGGTITITGASTLAIASGAAVGVGGGDAGNGSWPTSVPTDGASGGHGGLISLHGDQIIVDTSSYLYAAGGVGGRGSTTTTDGGNGGAGGNGGSIEFIAGSQGIINAGAVSASGAQGGNGGAAGEGVPGSAGANGQVGTLTFRSTGGGLNSDGSNGAMLAGKVVIGDAIGKVTGNVFIQNNGIVEAWVGDVAGQVTLNDASPLPFMIGSVGLRATGFLLINTASSVGQFGPINVPAVTINASAINLTNVGNILAGASGTGLVSASAQGAIDLYSSTPVTLGTISSIDPSPTPQGSVLVSAPAIALNNSSVISANGSGDAVTLNVVTGAGVTNFTNTNSGPSSPITTPNGRWLIFSQTPENDTVGNLDYTFRQYNRSYGSRTPIAGSGSGFLYSVAPSLTPALTGTVSKVYNGDVFAPVASADVSASGILNGDLITWLINSADYNNKNVGDGKTVGADVSLNNALDTRGKPVYGYQLASSTASGAVGSITRASISSVSGLTANNKTYDGGTGATLSTAGAAFNGMVAGDSLTVGSATGAFADKNAATGKTVNITGIALNGTDAGNYTLADTTATATADIIAKPVTLSAPSISKTYDGGTTYTASAGDLGNLSAALIGGDSVAAATITYANRNAGTGKTVTLDAVTLNDGNGGGNYSLTLAGNGTSIIAPKSVSFNIPALTKVYDGTVTYTASGSELGSFSASLVGGDTVTSAVASYADKNVGSGKTVTPSSMTISDGNGGNNYNVTVHGNSTSAITAKGITLTAPSVSKTYDGTTAYTVTSGDLATLSAALMAGDTVSAASITYADKNAGSGKTVTLDSAALNDGNGGANYSLTLAGNSTSAVVPRAVSFNIPALTKIYDGTTSYSANSGELASFTAGLLAGDTVTAAIATYADKNAGSGKTVSPASMTISDGNGGNNYAVAVHGNSTSSITVRPVNLTLPTLTKTYDGSPSYAASSSELAALSAGLVGGDTVTSAVATFADRQVGTGKTVTPGSYAIADGNGGNNYAVSFAGNSLSSITRLASVSWAGSSSGSWSVAANWAGGALPDAANVAAVNIPAGTTVTYDLPLASSAQLTSLNSSGALVIPGGQLTIAGTLSTAAYSQQGGTLTAGALTVGSQFTQTGGSILASGPVSLNQATGNLVLGAINAAALDLSAPAGSIGQSGGTSITAGSVAASAAQGIALDQNNHIAVFSAHNTTSGDITLTNTANPLTVSQLHNGGGSIVLDNTGGVIAAATIDAADSVTITAHSPITVNAPITAGNRITLHAASSLAGSDNLTINANLSAGSGGLSATAGNDIVMAGAARMTTANGPVDLVAGNNIVLGQIDAGSGAVYLEATNGSVSTASGAATPTVTAYSLLLRANTGATLSTAVQLLDITSTTGLVSIYDTITGTNLSNAAESDPGTQQTQQQVTSDINKTTTNPTDNSGNQAGTGGGGTQLAGLTSGGDEGEFGGDDKNKKDDPGSTGDNTKKDDKNAPKKFAQCTP